MTEIIPGQIIGHKPCPKNIVFFFYFFINKSEFHPTKKGVGFFLMGQNQ